jgi:hypothetical protein
MMAWEVVQQLVRIAMYFAGGLLTAYGIVIPPAGVAGVTITLTALAWWAYWQFIKKQPAPPLPDGGDKV